MVQSEGNNSPRLAIGVILRERAPTRSVGARSLRMTRARLLPKKAISEPCRKSGAPSRCRSRETSGLHRKRPKSRESGYKNPSRPRRACIDATERHPAAPITARTGFSGRWWAHDAVFQLRGPVRNIRNSKKRDGSMLAEVVRLPTQHQIVRILTNSATKMLNGVGWGSFCSGTLISPTHVLTVANCAQAESRFVV